MPKSLLRSIRNWPKKFISLHKIENRLDKIEQQLGEIAALPHYHSLNIGETALAAAGKEPNIYSFIKCYAKYIEPQNMRYFCDLAADFCGKSFVSQHYSTDFIEQRIKDGAAENFIKELSEDFLFPAEFDLTANHGINRPFKFWSAPEKQDYIHASLQVIEILNKLSPYACFGYGTALGARRNGRFIPHDDDCDILFYLPETAGIHNREEAVRYTADFLRQNGRAIKKTTPIHLKVFAGQRKDIDVFLCLGNERESEKHGEALRADWVPGSVKGFALDSLFPARNLLLEGITIPCPRAIEAYLTEIYGETWLIPDENFHYGPREWRHE